MKESPKNSAKSVSTNLYLVISTPIDTKYTVVQGKKHQKWQKLPPYFGKTCLFLHKDRIRDHETVCRAKNRGFKVVFICV